MIFWVGWLGKSIASEMPMRIPKHAQRKTVAREKNGMVKRPDSRLPRPVSFSLPRKTGPGVNAKFRHDVRHANKNVPIVTLMQLSGSTSWLKKRAVEVRIASRAALEGNFD